jgi:hypothetical protein
MFTDGTFRTHCCERMLNVLAQEPGCHLQVATKPLTGRGKRATILMIAVMTGDGEIRASCRHEVTASECLRWTDQITRIFDLAWQT